MVVDAIHVTASKKWNPGQNANNAKIEKKAKWRVELPGSCTKCRDNIRQHSTSMAQDSLSQPSTNAYIGYWCEISKTFFFNSIQFENNDCHFPFAGPQQAKRNHVPFLSRNAKICIISLEGTLRLDPTNLIFGLQTTTQWERSCWIFRNNGKLAVHMLWRRRSMSRTHRHM